MLAGRQLNVREALALCRYVGFRRTHLIQAVAIMTAESLRYTEASHRNDDGSCDRGLFQINGTAHPGLIDPFNPISNTRFAFALSNGGMTWKPWAAYQTERYRKAFTDTVTVYLLGRKWRKLIPKVPEMFG